MAALVFDSKNYWTASPQIEGKRILAFECEMQKGFITTEKLLVHLDDGTRIKIETGYVYDVKVAAQ